MSHLICCWFELKLYTHESSSHDDQTVCVPNWYINRRNRRNGKCQTPTLVTSVAGVTRLAPVLTVLWTML
jgi:hypothetical protein